MVRWHMVQRTHIINQPSLFNEYWKLASWHDVASNSRQALKVTQKDR
jgi:hypothetical protein